MSIRDLILSKRPAGFVCALAAAAVTGLVLGCGGGGGSGSGGSSGDSSVSSDLVLDDVTFIDPEHLLLGRRHTGPANAALVQRIALHFTGPVDLAKVSPSGVFVRDVMTGDLVAGTFQRGPGKRRLIFTPDLPTRPPRLIGSFWDVGDAGLQPGREYELVVPASGPDVLPFLGRIRTNLLHQYGFKQGDDLRIRFQTTTKRFRFWQGLPQEAPDLLSVTPSDGARDVAPHLFSDLAGTAPDWQPFELVFDAPLDPREGNVGPETFQLIDVKNGSGLPVGRTLPVRITIVLNTLAESRVRVEPVGVLPLGHELTLSIPSGLEGLSGGSNGGKGSVRVSRFGVWSHPGETIKDAVVENYVSSEREERAAEELEHGQVPADWDIDDSNRLEASLSFPGQGELGRFLPFPLDDTEDHVLILDTDVQELPLFDGSTPDVAFGTVVRGGVFNFSEIVIPERVVVVAEGSNPLVLAASDRVEIKGVIDVSGTAGSIEMSSDQSLTPLPGGVGGPGGGRGGDGHPAVFDGQEWIMNLVSPRRGQVGLGPAGPEVLGGRPGDCGVDTTKAMKCGTGVGGGRGAGAGGGTYLSIGEAGNDGLGDTTSSEKLDAAGNQTYEPLPDGVPEHGEPGDPVFRDEDAENDFIGRRGELVRVQGGQGGGGGGSRLDSYWCAGSFPGLPSVVADARGGGGGGGGGALEIRSLGEILMSGSGFSINARGGDGGGGEAKGRCNRGGGGGGGSGGAVRLITAANLRFDGVEQASISVRGGKGPGANHLSFGGDGGAGLVQFEVPVGTQLDYPPGVVDPMGPPLVSPDKTPSDLTSISVGQSVWINLGPGVFRDGRPGPDFAFRGTDNQGYVEIDESGYQVDPTRADIRVDSMAVVDPYTGRIVIPARENYIPDNASVQVLFQAAHARGNDPGRLDPATITPWTPDIDVADGRQFVRFRVIMDIAKDGSSRLTTELPRVAARLTRLRFTF